MENFNREKQLNLPGFDGLPMSSCCAVNSTHSPYINIRQQDGGPGVSSSSGFDVARGGFIENVSHGLRTQLNGVVGLVHLLRDMQLGREARELVEMLLTSAESLHECLGELLDSSKIEAGLLQLDKKAFSLRKVFGDATEYHARRARDKGLGFYSDVRTDVPDILVGDPARLSQVLKALVGNAIKYTHEGSVRVKCELNKISNGNACLCFSVINTGICMNAEGGGGSLRFLHQAQGPGLRSRAGAGFGFYFAASLIQLMGGELSVESSPGEGSVIYFGLCVALGEDGHLQAQGVPVGEQSNASGLHVLVAEDDKINQRLISRVLWKAGHEALVVDNGRKALNAFSSGNYDIILMDVMMPEMDGLEATRAIREQEQGTGGHIPIVAMTAKALKGDRDMCLESGMDEYMSKPLELKRLIALMERLARGNHRSA